MREEKMMILSMLEEGKITSEEAIKLLDALESSEYNLLINADKTEDKNSEYKNTDEKDEAKDEIKEGLRDYTRKIESFGTNLGNLISNIVNNIVDKTTFISSDGLYETINKRIERDISDVENPVINFESVNGSINVKPWNENNFSMNITCKYKGKEFSKDDVFYNFFEEGNKFRFIPVYKSHVMISLDVNLPSKYYKEITLKTTNGRIKIHDFHVGELVLETSNGSITAGNISSDKIDLLTQNGRILINDLSAPAITAKTSNASIAAENIKSRDLNISTMNGRISSTDIQSDYISGKTSNASIEMENIISKKVRLKTSNGAITCRDIDERNIEELNLSTSNSSINIALNNTDKVKYFDLETTLGSIFLEAPDLIYKVNKQANTGTKKVIAYSENFDEQKEHLLIKASTSNGSIKII